MNFLKPRFLKLSFAFFMLAVAAASAQSSAAPQNVEFSSTTYEAPAFYATFPVPDKDKGAVAYSSEDIKTKSGVTTTLHNYALSLHNDEDAFLVLYCDIPNTRSDTAALDQMLDGALAQLDNAKPNPKTDSTYSGLPARMVTATGTYTRGQTTFKVTAYQRVAVQGSRVWQGIVICDQRTNCSEADANKFLNSIKIR
ncbi:MAG TPA: hypothetical protein VNX26_00260 [Candidatus Acidoferrum sp.]|jgi:hypothetical protein|nr:hypothetical protein [Candidatus Acidoferrum sp.]